MTGRQLSLDELLDHPGLDRVRTDGPTWPERQRAPGRGPRTVVRRGPSHYTDPHRRERAARYHAALVAYQRAHKRQPTRRELADWLECSPSTVHEAACDAEALGLVHHLYEHPGRRRARGSIPR